MYFSQIIKGIKINKNDLYNALPEKVYRYLANRAKISNLSGIFVDGICEHGGGLIYFGITGIFQLLIGIDKSQDHIKIAKSNCQLYKIRGYSEFIKSKF